MGSRLAARGPEFIPERSRPPSSVHADHGLNHSVRCGLIAPNSAVLFLSAVTGLGLCYFSGSLSELISVLCLLLVSVLSCTCSSFSAGCAGGSDSTLWASTPQAHSEHFLSPHTQKHSAILHNDVLVIGVTQKWPTFRLA